MIRGIGKKLILSMIPIYIFWAVAYGGPFDRSSETDLTTENVFSQEASKYDLEQSTTESYRITSSSSDPTDEDIVSNSEAFVEDDDISTSESKASEQRDSAPVQNNSSQSSDLQTSSKAKESSSKAATQSFGNSRSGNAADIQTASNSHTANDLKWLMDQNPDIIGWIVLNNTSIDYPILQGSDNKYYLTHNYLKESSNEGSVFLDYRLHPDFSDQNNIIYGHNTQSGTMFSRLINFKTKSYFDSHKTGTLYTSDKTYTLEIFSVYVTEYIGNPYTWYFVAPNPFNSFITQIKNDSKYYRDISLNWGDRILTLSTCSYEFTNARTVVHAKIVE